MTVSWPAGVTLGALDFTDAFTSTNNAEVVAVVEVSLVLVNTEKLVCTLTNDTYLPFTDRYVNPTTVPFPLVDQQVWHDGSGAAYNSFAAQITTTFQIPGKTPIVSTVYAQPTTAQPVWVIATIPEGDPANPVVVQTLAPLDDAAPSADTVYSSQKTVDLIPSQASIDQSVADGVAEAVPSISGKISGPNFIWNGDSLSAMGGGLTPPVNPAAFLASFTDKTVLTDAVGGETSVGVAARQGGNPYLMLPVGASIPTSGAVTVTLSNGNGGFQWPLLQTNGNPTLGQVMVGSLAGIPGTVALVQPSGASTSHQDGDFYTFTRTTPGTIVAVTRPTSFYQDFAIAHRGDVQIIQAGKNDCLDSTQFTHDQAVAQVLANVAAMVHYAEASEQRYVVVGVHNGTGEGSTNTTMYPRYIDTNAALQAAYGRRFVDYRPYLISYGLADSGLAPTTGDTSDIAADTVPRSLLVADGTHFQIPTRQIVGWLVAQRIAELGWAPIVTAFVTPAVLTPPSGDQTAFWQANPAYVVTADPVTVAAGTAAVSLFDAAPLTNAHQKVTATITRGTATSTGLVARAIDANNLYGVRINATGNVLLYKIVGGTTASLSGADGLWTADGSSLTLETSGSTITAYVNGVQVLQKTDTSLTAPGYAGLRVQPAGATKPTWTAIAIAQYAS